MTITTNETFDEFAALCTHRQACSTQCRKEYCQRIKRKPIRDAAEHGWRENSEAGYQKYIEDHNFAYSELVRDTEWMHKMEKWYPGVDILESINKAAQTFWATRDGWTWRRTHGRSKTLNWKTTYQNALCDYRHRVKKAQPKGLI